MSWKRTFAKLVFYLSFVALFVVFYVKDLLSDFIEGRSTMTSQIQPVESIEFPTVTLCMKPGHKNSVIKKYGLTRATDVVGKSFTDQSLSDIFSEISFINGRDFDIIPNAEQFMDRTNLKHTLEPIFTFHHGTCYRLEPVSVITDMPQYLAVRIILKDIKVEDKPKGVNIYLTSNKTWPNIAHERWPQISPTKFFIEFAENGLVTGMKLKLTEHVFDEGNENITDCHRNLFLAKSNCTIKCNFLSYTVLPKCNSTEDQVCGNKARKNYPNDFENCFKTKRFITYNPATYEYAFNPTLNSSTIQFFMSIRDLQKEVREEVKAITIESFIGSLGGSVGMFFGFSFTATILYITEKLKTMFNHFFFKKQQQAE